MIFTHRENTENKPFCLYAHFIDNELVYIGLGSERRAHKTTCERSKHILDEYKQTPPTVIIFDYVNTFEEAQALEDELQNEYKPRLNKLRQHKLKDDFDMYYNPNFK